MPPYADIITLSVKVALASVALALPLAVGAGYLLSKKRFRGKLVLTGIIDLPLVMPPVTTGYLLLMLFGRQGPLGPFLDAAGVRIAFTTFAAVLAAAVVAFPLMVRNTRLGFDLVAPALEGAARTLGATPAGTLWRVTLPLALPGILSAAVLGFARSLGEFGATITFAGNIDGVSRTIPLAVYTHLQTPGEERAAAVLVIISIVLSFGAMSASTLVSRRLGRESPDGH